MNGREALLKQQTKQYKMSLDNMELAVRDMELRARRQRAVTQLKQDFITEMEITPMYEELLAKEQERLAAEVSDNQELPTQPLPEELAEIPND